MPRSPGVSPIRSGPVSFRSPAARQLRGDGADPRKPWRRLAVRADRPPQDDPDMGRRRADPELVIAAARPQGDPHRRGRPSRPRAWRRRDRRQQPRRAPARPRPRQRRRPRRDRRRDQRSNGELGRRRGPVGTRHRDRARSRGTGRAARPARLLGAGRRGHSGCRTRAGDPPRGADAGYGAPRHADPGRPHSRSRRRAGTRPPLIGRRAATAATPARHRPAGTPRVA